MVMDLHAHLDTAEIIGLLAGSYSPQSRHIRVEAAFPVNELATEDDRYPPVQTLPGMRLLFSCFVPVRASGSDHKCLWRFSVNVEMDPEDQVRVCAHIQDQGMVCVGWYHSHPDFPAIPSVVDIENQVWSPASQLVPSASRSNTAAVEADC